MQKMEELEKFKKEYVNITNQINEHKNEINKLEITRDIIFKKIYELERKEN